MLEFFKAHWDWWATTIGGALITAALFIARNQKLHDTHKRDIADVNRKLDALNLKVDREQEKREASRAAMDRKLDTIGEGVQGLTVASAQQKTFLETLHGQKIG